MQRPPRPARSWSCPLRARRASSTSTICVGCCSASTSAETWPPSWPSTRRRADWAVDAALCERRSRCSPRSPTCASWPATVRPRARSRPATGCTARGSTSTPTCTAWTRPRAAAGVVLAIGSAGCCTTTASPTWTARRRWRRRSTGSSWPSPAAPSHLHLVTSVLQQWLPADALDGIAAQARDVLDRLVAATQLRYPVVGDLARSARFRWFDQPLVEADRGPVLAGVRDELDYLAATQRRADYAARIDGLWRSPGADRAVPGRADRRPAAPSTSRCSRCWPAGTTANTSCRHVQPPASVRRPVRHLRLRPGQPPDPPGQHGGRDLGAGAGVRARPGHRRPAGADPGRPSHRRRPIPALARRAESDRRRFPTRCASCSNALAFAHRARRVAIAAVWRGRSAGGLLDVPARARGHLSRTTWCAASIPMVGRRLDLWRLRDFNVTRLDAPEDVLLYHCVAPNNDADQRLVALAQIRRARRAPRRAPAA